VRLRSAAHPAYLLGGEQHCGIILEVLTFLGKQVAVPQTDRKRQFPLCAHAKSLYGMRRLDDAVQDGNFRVLKKKGLQLTAGVLLAKSYAANLC
jgi:hypothetical protein